MFKNKKDFIVMYRESPSGGGGGGERIPQNIILMRTHTHTGAVTECVGRCTAKNTNTISLRSYMRTGPETWGEGEGVCSTTKNYHYVRTWSHRLMVAEGEGCMSKNEKDFIIMYRVPGWWVERAYPKTLFLRTHTHTRSSRVLVWGGQVHAQK
eukprot:GEMP01033982.1.p2 GENE.GEMP01033982.1~~GEMP01033982.1.p2  ORF type:complete len:153 (-),score=10.69 GEMP01033982.1:1193-1651(-)